MKSFAAGALNCLTLALFLCSVVRGAVPNVGNRTLWLSEQLVVSSAIRSEDQTAKFSAGLAQVYDAFSLQGQLVANLGLFEVSLRGAHRFLLHKIEKAENVRSLMDAEAFLLGLELSRTYISPGGFYGKLGFEYLQPFPETVRRWLKLAVHTGVLPKTDSPWDLNFHLALLFPTFGNVRHLVIGADVERLFPVGQGSSLGVGAAVTWNYQLTGALLTSIAGQEHMLLTMGPVCALTTKTAQFRALAGWRLWIDQARDAVRTYYPQELEPYPTATLSASFNF